MTRTERDQIQLPSEMTIGTATTSKAVLQHSLDVPPTRAVIDASEVRKIDVAGLQLIASFTAALRESGSDIEWGPVSEEARAASREAGWSGVLGE